MCTKNETRMDSNMKKRNKIILSQFHFLLPNCYNVARMGGLCHATIFIDLDSKRNDKDNIICKPNGITDVMMNFSGIWSTFPAKWIWFCCSTTDGVDSIELSKSNTSPIIHLLRYIHAFLFRIFSRQFEK